MNQNLLKLAKEIRLESEHLKQSIERSQKSWQKFQQTNDELYLDSVALSLHNFYSGLERLFERIARRIDDTLPQGANWHQLLLEQMSVEIPDSRPAVISQRSQLLLQEYRGLRHIVRNVYAFQFDASKLKPLIEKAPTTLTKVNLELLAFATFLEKQVET